MDIAGMSAMNLFLLRVPTTLLLPERISVYTNMFSGGLP